jgi:hypothetical protein
MELIATDRRTKKPICNIISLRGDIIAIYLRVIYNDKKYVVLTKQLRVPIGHDILEISSGIIDVNEKTYFDVAIQEIIEKTGINISNENNFIPLGDFLSCPTSCDECIKLLYLEVIIDEDIFNKIQSESKSINIVLVAEEEYENVLKTMKDAKSIIAHNFAKEKNLLN